MDPSKDFYAVLALPRDASARQIKNRFRELARERHPDRFHGEEKARAEVEFQDITEAFNALIDPVRRRQVDLALARPTQAKHDPHDVTRVYLNRGIRAYKQGNWIEAASNFDRATQSAPDNPQTWHHLALTCLKEKRWWPKAQEAVSRACELRPDHAPYLKLAGRIYAQSGMTARAKQYYNQALKLGGSDAEVRSALAQLTGEPQGEPRAEPDKAKSGLFRKIW